MPNLPGVQPLKGTSARKETSSANAVNSMWLKSDNGTLQQLDPTSLEPVGFAEHHKFHPDLKGPLAAAHSRTDPVTGDTYNFNLQVGRQATYRVFRISASTDQTSILATLAGGPILGTYIHSIMFTSNRVILCIFSAYLSKNGLQMLWTRNILDALESPPRPHQQMARHRPSPSTNPTPSSPSTPSTPGSKPRTPSRGRRTSSPRSSATKILTSSAASTTPT